MVRTLLFRRKKRTGDTAVPKGAHPAAECSYAPVASEDELLKGAQVLKAWINKNPDYIKTGHVIVFAWNESEEGGWICPTKNNDGINFSRLNAFKKAAAYLKNKAKLSSFNSIAGNAR